MSSVLESHAEIAAAAQSALDGYGSDHSVASDDSELEVVRRMAAEKQGKGKGVMNRKALEHKLAEMRSKRADFKWIDFCGITPEGCVPVEDAEDDLQRELVFYKNAQTAVYAAVKQYEDAGVEFWRPVDFYAEMIKTDAHMEKVKGKLLMEQKKMQAVESRKAAQKNKKYNKQIMAERQKERASRKRDAQKQVDEYRRAKDLDTAGDGPAMGRKRVRAAGAEAEARGKQPNAKRKYKDSKFGFGGKKKLEKQNDSKSASDMSKFNGRRNRDPTGFLPRSKTAGKGAGNRPGKARRQQARGKR